MSAPKDIFYMGKGGVGKSTSTALNALYLARKGYDVVIVSLDPAHNQADIFQKPLSNRAERVAPNLRVVEVDQDYWVKRYLKGIHDQINSTYRYLTSFNLEKYFKVIKHSPGLEEHALILAFEEAKRKFAKCDFLVFDMAPTAISLKFFSLPSLSLVWIDHLAALREEVIENQVDLGLSRILEALLQYRVLFPQLTYLREHFVRFNLLTHHLDLGDEFSFLNHLFTQSGQVTYPYQGKRGKAEELEGYRCRRHVEHKKITLGKLPFGLLKSQNESVFLQARRVLDHLEILL